jgi:hypothetical protein
MLQNMAVTYCPPLSFIASSSQLTITHKYVPAVLSKKDKRSDTDKFPFLIRHPSYPGRYRHCHISSELMLLLVSLSIDPHLKASNTRYVSILVYD